MKTSLKSHELSKLLSNQLNSIIPDPDIVDQECLQDYVAKALVRLEYSFAHTKRKYFHDGKDAMFSHLQSDQYAMYLYLVSNSIFQAGSDLKLADKIYCLNKSLHSIDVFYQVQMPEIFLFRHCVGTVLGRAEYGNYFTVGANCTVGNSRSKYPVIGDNVALYNSAMIVGSSTIGSECHIAANTLVLNQDVPSCHVAFGQSPDLNCKPASSTVHKNFFDSLTLA